MNLNQIRKFQIFFDSCANCFCQNDLVYALRPHASKNCSCMKKDIRCKKSDIRNR